MKKGIPNWVIVISTLSVFMFLVILTFNLFNLYDFKYDIDKDGNIVLEQNKFLINKEINSFYDEDTKGFYIEGVFKNNTKRTYYDVSLSYTIYDLEGNILGNAYAYIDRISSEENWKFKASYLDVDATDAVSYKLIDISYN